MAKVVVYALLTTAFIIFVIFFPVNVNQQYDEQPFGLNRRLGYKLPVPNFDPLVDKMQRLAEEKGLTGEGNPINLEKNSYAAEVEGANEYFSDDGKLNITSRFLVLFPLLDKAPKDGKISLKELQAWNKEQAIHRLIYRTRKEMELRDKDRDGAISFNEYLPQFSNEDIDKNEKGHGEAGWWMEQFRNADVDRNGTLSLDEFNNFLHPEDSNNKEIQKWVLREKIKLMDDDRDGKLNFVEFSKYVYDIYKSYAEFEQAAAGVRNAEVKFDELDINKDKFVAVEELIPMLHYLKPGELSYAKYYTTHLMHEADDDGDGHLTLHEMLNHEYTFYNTLYDDNHEDYDDYFHDEL